MHALIGRSPLSGRRWIAAFFGLTNLQYSWVQKRGEVLRFDGTERCWPGCDERLICAIDCPFRRGRTS